MGSEKLLFRLEQPHGTGDVYLAWQKGSGIYLATTGVDSIVNIFDRYGEIQERIKLQSLCTGFAWDTDGDILAIISQASNVILWDSNTMKKQSVDVGLKDTLSCLIWAKQSPILAVGTTKGNISIYYPNTSKRIPIIGKHSKKIVCGAWNEDNLLALGSEDKTLSISNVEGDTLRIVSLRAEPSEMMFSEMKSDERVKGENTLSLIIGKRTLYLYNLLDPDNPVELAFQPHYGAMVTYKWFGDGYILIGFSAGYFISISTHLKEVGQELFQVRNHKNFLTGIEICEAIGLAASCGDNTVKIHDLNNLQETLSVLTLTQESGIDRMAWSKEGQLLAVATKGGSVNVYITYMPLLSSVCLPRIAVLSNLTEISVFNYSTDKMKLKPIPVTLEVEPSFIAVGPYHLVAGMNNNAWFYDLTKPQPDSEDSPLRLKTKQYMGAVSSIKLNSEYASVLFEGKIQLHLIEPLEISEDTKEIITFPEEKNIQKVIMCHELTTDFLIYATDMGHIVYFHIEEWAKALEYKHTIGIMKLYADPAGTRLIFFDMKNKGYLYNAVSNEVILIPDIPNKVTGAIWDSNIGDRNTFIIYDDLEIVSYIYILHSVEGCSVKRIGVTSLVAKQTPLLMYAGEVTCATSGGQLFQVVLTTHDSQSTNVDKDNNLESNFEKQLSLCRFNNAVKTCAELNSTAAYEKLAIQCMKTLEIELAIRIYKQIDNVPMVWNLESISDVEDCKLLCGYMSLFLTQYDVAQQWFLKSNTPIAALEMRRDLLQWDIALQLAKKMAPEQIAMISREYAQQLEFIGNYSEALRHYEKGLQENLGPEHVLICKSGIARTNLHCGNYRHGMSVAIELDDKQLLRECAEILDKKKQLAESAILFEKCSQYDKAASNYIKLKKWNKVGELLPSVNSPKIHLLYAKAKENDKEYGEAIVAYEKAKDYDSMIRLHLEHLNNPEIAVELVQETKSIEGAKMVAKFFQNLNDLTSAIKFLVLSKCTEEAFSLAKNSGKMELYAETLLNSFTEDEIRPQDFFGIATHFENEKNYLMAGKYWFHAREYQKAMRLLLKAAKSNSKEKDAITIAIDVVASSNDEALSNVLIEYLLGETDGIPKDPKFLFRLYMAKKQFREASRSALIIANEEQINGVYRNAHDVLFGMCQELKQNGIKIPYEMYINLMLLHSYILVRLHVKRGDHMKAARMLIRVANNISKFPSHIVPILTSTVIECYRAGLKQESYKYATLLMKPEYRKSIDLKYSRKIEAVVRKPPKKDGEITDPIEPTTPCPYCDNKLLETEMLCGNCKNNIPFCIVTGRHIVSDDLTACPECDFPAIRKEFLEILESEEKCPMCAEKIDFRRLVKIENIKPYLNIE